jgi:hypothetical protein
MNQVLEQMDQGPVNLVLVARIKAHPMYDQRPMVKELLESIIAAQPAAVRKEASKVIDHAQVIPGYIFGYCCLGYCAQAANDWPDD